MDHERLPRVLSALRQVADQTGVSVARIALAWQLTRPFLTSVIIGAKTPEQLLDNLAAVDVSLSAEQVQLLDQASALPNEYPGWMLDRQNSEPRGVFGQVGKRDRGDSSLRDWFVNPSKARLCRCPDTDA